MPASIQRVARGVPLSGILFLATFIVPYALLALYSLFFPHERYAFESIGTTASFQNYDRLDLLVAFEWFRTGGNPYDQQALARFFAAHAAPGYPHAFNLFYPPWMLTIFALPLSLPFAAASMIWFAVNVAFVAIAGAVAWSEIRGNRDIQRGVSAALLFLPVAFVLFWGQMSLFVTAALAVAFQALRRRKDVAAGFFLALATIKPTMWFVAMICVVALIIVQRRWVIALSAFATVAVFSAVAEYISPHIFVHWLESATAVSDFSQGTLQPNLAGLLRYLSFHATGYIPRWPQLLLPCFATGIICATLHCTGGRPLIWWFCVSIVLSVLAAPYGWFQDAVLLLVVQVVLLAAVSREYPGALELITSLAAVQLAGLVTALASNNQFAFVWFSFAIGAIFLRHQRLLVSEKIQTPPDF